MFEAVYQTANFWLGSVAIFIDTLPFSYALGAGMIASINPCGFIMLPAFAAFYLTAGEDPEVVGAAARFGRALKMGGYVTLAFVATFALTGAIVSLAGYTLLQWTGWAGLAVGVVLIGLGVYQVVTRRSVFGGVGKGVRITPRATSGGAMMFGAGYALASLSCTLPIFLTVVSGAFVDDRLAESVLDFVQYGLGMGIVLTIVTIGIGLFRAQTVHLVSGALPYVTVAGNVFLVFAGAYLVWYWTVLGQLI